MSCLNALYSQSVTLLSVPQEILLLQHKVFQEYAKTTVGPDFVHTLPSFLIVAALAIALWRNPPSFNSLVQVLSWTVYRALQVMVGWVVGITGLWFWLILQRLLYCYTWTYWSYESEYLQNNVSYQWWQRVWSSYYPSPMQPPAVSASFISWLLSMSIAVVTLGCSLYINRIRDVVLGSAAGLKHALRMLKYYAVVNLKRMLRLMLQHHRSQQASLTKPIAPVDGSDASLLRDECRFEVSSDVNNPARREVHPIAYGTNWMPKPSFSGYKEPQRKVSMKSMHTLAVVNDIEESDIEESDKLMPRQLRHRRGCHTVVPYNSSDKSSGC
nr:uncharacterized protein LOC116424577 [Nomia melanderi]